MCEIKLRSVLYVKYLKSNLVNFAETFVTTYTSLDQSVGLMGKIIIKTKYCSSNFLLTLTNKCLWLLQEVKLQNNMKDEEIKALRDRMIKMESIIPVQVRWCVLLYQLILSLFDRCLTPLCFPRTMMWTAKKVGLLSETGAGLATTLTCRKSEFSGWWMRTQCSGEDACAGWNRNSSESWTCSSRTSQRNYEDITRAKVSGRRTLKSVLLVEVYQK